MFPSPPAQSQYSVFIREPLQFQRDGLFFFPFCYGPPWGRRLVLGHIPAPLPSVDSRLHPAACSSRGSNRKAFLLLASARAMPSAMLIPTSGFWPPWPSSPTSCQAYQTQNLRWNLRVPAAQFDPGGWGSQSSPQTRAERALGGRPPAPRSCPCGGHRMRCRPGGAR